MKKLSLALLLLFTFLSCKENQKAAEESAIDAPFFWENATIYFLLTDRFNNGNPTNDVNFNRTNETAVLRGFMGGDIQGITQKINEGYFSDLGVNAIWFTPIVEQIHGDTDEGTGNTYGYHGYWTKDWTALDPNFGTYRDLEEMVQTAHSKGIRVLMDAVLNHTGPVTEEDPVWPKDWVREDPTCEFTTYENTTACSLVDNLPDILTESDAEVALPEQLLTKWKNEGRLDKELKELDVFFNRTGYTRNPRAYIIKWLTDYVNELGVDGYRVDTVKHADEKAWAELYEQGSYSFENWKSRNPDKKLDDTAFYMMGEVYNYGISGGRDYDFGDKKVDYFAHGFNSLINFELKYDAIKDYESVFTKYDSLLHTTFKGKGVVNYLTSHDDGQPFDKSREKPFKTANILLLTPGTSQIYYGDETARDLTIDGTQGDATLRSFMNWDDLKNSKTTQEIHQHWMKLGQFRNNHIAVGAGKHQLIPQENYVFGRTYEKEDFSDKVIVGIDLPKGKKEIIVKDFFKEGANLRDSYSNTEVRVQNGTVSFDNENEIVLLELMK